MLQSTLEVNEGEENLIFSMRELGFGELFGVEITETARDRLLAVNKAEFDLIEFIRRGTQYIDVLSVHQGCPCLAEIDFKSNGFRCRKKIKFPTSREEGC